MAYTRAQFINKVGPMAEADAETSKVLASLTIAQAILESNNGNSTLTAQGNALFGIKATGGWCGKVWTGKTLEYYNPNTPTTVTAGFRAYDSWQESIADHSKLLTSASRYSKVVGEMDYTKACEAIAKAGYATDPQYASKLIGLIKINNLTRFDKVVANDLELSNAVSTTIKKGIDIDFNKWKRKDLFKLADVPFLVCKLAGVKVIGTVSTEQYTNAIDKLVLNGYISQRLIWDEKRYTENNVRSLLIKFSLKK